MSESAMTAEAGKLKYKKSSKFQEFWRRFKKNKRAIAGLVILCFFILIAIFADVIADYDTMVIAQNSSIRLQGPSAEHIFGTDGYGRDLFARVVHGTRVSLSIGVVSVFFCIILGGILGSITGFYGGRVDDIIMRILDTVNSIPPILLSLSIVAALGAGMRNMLIAITISRIPVFTRVIRSSIISVVDEQYVEAARCCGTNEALIILKHVLPNAMGPIIVQATMSVAQTILTAATLSFMGMGIQPPRPEWGFMLSEGREYMRHAPYLCIFPGCAMALSALSINMIGDGLRDALDPKLKD